jgi:uncharacterized protein (DUF488 family)
MIAMQLPQPLYTVGHSTLSLEAFLGLLSSHSVRCLADIRRFPGSRKYPHFNREAISTSLHDAGIDYVWIESLGGRRGRQSKNPSANTALRNDSFRNYADYMATDDFRRGVDELLELARNKVTACMCSEAVYWRCHRRLVSDYLMANGIVAQHIMSTGKPRPHTLTPGAVMTDGAVTYPGDAQP